MPGFSNAISAIVGAMQSENEREFSMTRTVLSDPALTHRVLRLANSAMYAMFGEINTVSAPSWCWAPRPSATWRWA